MSPRVRELSFSRLDSIFADSTPTYIKYLMACRDSLVEGKNDLQNCLSQHDCDAFSRVRHKLQPNLELMGLVLLREDLSEIEHNPTLLSSDRVQELAHDIEEIEELIQQKIQKLSR